MASNPVSANNQVSTIDKLRQILKTVTDAALFIEQILAVTGLEGASAAEVERLTAAFGNLAAVAIQAAHDAGGKEISNRGDCPCGGLNGNDGLRPLSREARYLWPSIEKSTTSCCSE